MSVADLVWSQEPAGFTQSLERADALDKTDCIAADILRASTFYSYSKDPQHPIRSFANFCVAKRYARMVAKEQLKPAAPTLTDGQYDVIGTILLRRWLWQKAEARWLCRSCLHCTPCTAKSQGPTASRLDTKAQAGCFGREHRIRKPPGVRLKK